MENPAVTCKNGLICAPGNVCDDAHGGCATQSQIIGCTGKAEEAACSYQGVSEGACYNGVCLPAGCGNGVLAADEVCDDGNRMHGDGCSADCLSTEQCGNGIIDEIAREQCDDGNLLDGDTCQSTCRSPRCGDGIKDVAFNEACDMGADNSNAANAACRTNCQPKRCGDHVMDTGEVCDDGNVASGDGCSADCHSNENCGNAVVDPGEGCDDGDTVDGAGCRANCTIPICGDGITDMFAFEQCDDGASNSDSDPDACRTNCRSHFCGDGIPDSDEVCDDGNNVPGDGCFYSCQSNETCGNGLVDFSRGEQCEDGDTQRHDGCAVCKQERPAWTPANPSLIPARTRPAIAYDFARGRILVFGGLSGNAGYLNDTWEWDGRTWSNVTPTTGNPTARERAVMVYDAARAKVVLFGGYDGITYLDDTWEWNGSAWTAIAPSLKPPGRAAHVMAYDAARKRTVLFGGRANSTTRLGDTWTWDGTSWTNVTPTSSNPPARSDSAATYDPSRGRVVMFGGLAPGFRNDTWEWNGSSWSDVTPATGNPPVRGIHGLAYSVARGRVVLYGGNASSGYLGDAWEWNGSAWASITLAKPIYPIRGSAALAYDVARAQLVMFGGVNTGPGGDTYDETWTLDGNVWTNVTPGIDSPAPSNTAAYDPVRGRVLLYVGGSHSTWSWNGTSWRDLTTTGIPPITGGAAVAFDSARKRLVLFGGSNASGGFENGTWEWDGIGWTSISSSVSPPARVSHVMTYDSARGRIVMFGGTDDPDYLTYLNDTWEWDGTSWTNVTPASGNPLGRMASALTYDAGRGRAVLFGGYRSSGALADTWEWNGIAWANISSSPATPPARSGHALAFDGSRGRVVMFGGSSTTDTWEWNGSAWTDVSPATGSPSARSYCAMAFDASRGRVVMFGASLALFSLGETWEWDGSSWKDVSPTTGTPAGRQSHALAYDEWQGRVMLFGGNPGFNRDWADTWEWTGQSWQRVTPPSGGPSPREGHALAYDAARERIVLFGGHATSTDSYVADTWEWNGSTWTNVTPASGNPTPRRGHALAYDKARRRVVMFGGHTGGTNYLDDTWEWDGAAWSNMTPASGSPVQRVGHALVYDAAHGGVLLFGGFNGANRNDTWKWDGLNWTPVTTATRAPQPRRDHTMAYDAARGHVLLFGGVQGNSGFFNDTWEWDGTDWTDVTSSSTTPAVRSQHAMAYDAAHRQLVVFGGRGGVLGPYLNDTWTFRYENPAPADGCVTGVDGDGDGKSGCADPDCFGFCTPSCNPTLMTCDPSLPHCGDSVCQGVESSYVCPGDCGPPAAVCGNFLCDAGETTATCPGDCP